MKRLGCAFCALTPPKALLIAGEHRSELLSVLRCVRAAHDHTFRCGSDEPGTSAGSRLELFPTSRSEYCGDAPSPVSCKRFASSPVCPLRKTCRGTPFGRLGLCFFRADCRQPRRTECADCNHGTARLFEWRRAPRGIESVGFGRPP